MVLEAVFSFCHNETRSLYFGEIETAPNEILERHFLDFAKANLRRASQARSARALVFGGPVCDFLLPPCLRSPGTRFRQRARD
jgi:hypothetical protein